jgi:phospholipase C
VIRTLRERFSLGPPLTGRDAVAADIAPVLTRTTPPAQEDWPEVTAPQVPPLLDPLVQMDQPLPPLGKQLLGTAIALDTMHTGQVPGIDPKTATGRQARDYMINRQSRIWPGLTG